MGCGSIQLNRKSQDIYQDSEILPTNLFIQDEIGFGQKKLHEITHEQIQQDLHACTGAIIFKHHNIHSQTGRGTGFLISSNLVLTVAHNIFDRDSNMPYSGFLFYPGQRGVLKNPYEVERVFFPEEYKNSVGMASLHHDYALLKLKKEIERNNFLELATNYRSCLDKIGIWGYPDNAYESISNRGDIFETFQKGLSEQKCITNVNEEQKYIFYLLSTYPGQSGSAISLVSDSQAQNSLVIGIHKGGCASLKANAGRLITYDLIEKIEAWRMSCGGAQFKWKKLDHRLGDRNRLYQWDINSLHSNKFKFQGPTIKKVIPFDTSTWKCHYATSLHPVSLLKKCSIKFTAKYADRNSIFYFGLITQSLRKHNGKQISYKQESIAYLTKNQDQKGYIYVKGRSTVGRGGLGVSQIFVQDGKHVVMRINLAAKTVLFDNPGKGTWRVQIDQNFDNKQIYAFVSMKYKNDFAQAELILQQI